MADQNQDSDPFEDAEPTPEPKPDESESEDVEKGEGESESATGLLPKTFFGSKPLTPGTKCSVEIVKAYEDEVQVRYIPHKESKTAKAEKVDDEAEALYAD